MNPPGGRIRGSCWVQPGGVCLSGRPVLPWLSAGRGPGAFRTTRAVELVVMYGSALLAGALGMLFRAAVLARELDEDAGWRGLELPWEAAL